MAPVTGLLLKGITMDKTAYREARRMIRENGRAAYRWLGTDGEKLRELADEQDWLAERADIVAWSKREGVPVTPSQTRAPR